MNTFTKKSLYAALAGLGALGAAGSASAVSVNSDGLGQVLIYPYYTVRTAGGAADGNAYNSLLSVVNTTGSAKAVKVRFIEGKASKEVLDFNLYLSKFDVWTAAVIPSASGGAGIITQDVSCTSPNVSNDVDNPSNFVNYAYLGDPVEDDSLDRGKEGYVEIIEMGDLVGAAATLVTHVNGVAPCSGNDLDDAISSSDVVTGSGGLFGGITLINVLEGTDVGADAVALADFSATPIFAAPGLVDPNLGAVNPPVSNVLVGNTIATDFWFDPIDAVSAVFMHSTVLNEFVLDKATASGTDFVMTMPTKSFYFDSDGNVQGLFQRDLDENGSCDDVLVTRYDREERTVASGTSFSPPPPTFDDALCWESTVVTFNNSNVLGSTNSVNLPTTFENGWVNITFEIPVDQSYHVLFGSSNTFSGLPVIGFAVQTFNNGTLTDGDGAGIQSAYGGAFVHRYQRSIGIGFIPVQ